MSALERLGRLSIVGGLPLFAGFVLMEIVKSGNAAASAAAGAATALIAVQCFRLGVVLSRRGPS